jgi:integrase
MAIRQRNESWQVDVTINGRRTRKDFATKDEAEEYELGVKRKLRRGEALDETTGGNLSDLLESTRARHWDGTKGEATAVHNGQAFVDFLGPTTDPRRVGSTQIDAYIAKLKRDGAANGTVNRKLAAVSKMLHHAIKRGWITSMPAIERLPETEHRIRFLTPEEEGQVFGWFEDHSDQHMLDVVALMLDTGLRASEAFGLTPANIHNGRILLSGDRTKSGKGRVVPLTTRAASIVERRMGNELILGSDISYWTAINRWNDMKAGLGWTADKQLVLHALRHTFATRLMEAGANPAEVQKLMGHATIAMTMRYTHVSDERLENAIGKLTQFIRESDVIPCDRLVTGTVTKRVTSVTPGHRELQVS